jgi:hypothetical protein
MTNNQTNQPFEPFRVQSNLLQGPAQAVGAGNRGTDGPGKTAAGGTNVPFGNFDWNDARWLAMVPFGVIYWITENDVLLRPMTILVLLACLLFRLERRAREIAGVPLTLAAIKLAYQMSPRATILSGTQALLSEQFKAAMTGLPWVPMFLAACIFYLPQKGTVTGTIVRAGAFALLISGLLPGNGYIVILAMIQYTLFVGVLAGLIADQPWNGAAQNVRRAVPSAQA